MKIKAADIRKYRGRCLRRTREGKVSRGKFRSLDRNLKKITQVCRSEKTEQSDDFD